MTGLYLEKKETFPGSNCEFSRETNGKTKVNGLYLEKKETSPGSNCEFSREANGKTKNSAGEFRERERERGDGSNKNGLRGFEGNH